MPRLSFPIIATYTCFCIQLAFAQANGPRIQFQEESFDFGKLASGELAKHAFVFTNTGDATLEIINVAPGCGCTTAGDWTRRVEPGQTGTIPIQFNTSSFGGTVQKGISVTCNDKQRAAVALTIRANIWKPVDVQPQFAVLTMGPDASQAASMVRIVNNTDQPLKLSPPQPTNPAFKAELLELQPGKEYQLKLMVTGPLPQGNTQAQIVMQTGLQTPASINVVAWVNVQPPMHVMPAQISLPPAPLPAPATPSLIIQNNSTNALVISEPVINAEGVAVQINETQPGRTFNVVLTFPRGFEIPAGKQIDLTLKTSNPRNPSLKIPVVQFPKPVQAMIPGMPGPGPGPVK